MERLEGWYFSNNGKIRLHGHCYDSLRFSDGTFINTTRIAKVSADKDRLMVTTKSGSDYLLEFAHAASNWNAAEVNNFIGISNEMAAKIDSARSAYFMHFVETKSSLLRKNELFLQLANPYDYVAALFKCSDGAIIEIHPDFHVGMYQDSIIFREGKTVDFRVYPRQFSLECYLISEGLQAVYFENVGSDDIDYVCDIGNSIRIPAHGGIKIARSSLAKDVLLRESAV